MKVYSPEPLDAVDYHERADGRADVRLRRNFAECPRQDEQGSYVEYSADELYFVTDMTRDEIEASAETLWIEIERERMTSDERIAALEAASIDTQMALCDFYETVIGG